MNQKIPSINLNNLFYAHKILEFGSIKKAAEELGMAKSTLSEHLAQLESSLDRKIFTRGKKGLSVTAEGQALHRYTNLIFKTADKIKFHFSKQKNTKRSLDIGVLSSVVNSRTSKFLLPLFADNKIFVKVHQADSANLIKNFIHGELDVLLTDYKLELSMVDIESIFLGSTEYVLVYNPKHKKIEKTFSSGRGLMPIVHYSVLSEPRWMTEKFFSEKNIHLDVLGECDDVDLVREIILNSPCCAMLPLNFVQTDIGQGNLALLDKTSIYKSLLYGSYIKGDELDMILLAISRLKDTITPTKSKAS